MSSHRRRSSFESELNDWRFRHKSTGIVVWFFTSMLLLLLPLLLSTFMRPGLLWITPTALLTLAVVLHQWTKYYRPKVRQALKESDLITRIAADEIPQISDYVAWPWKLAVYPVLHATFGTSSMLKQVDRVAADLDWFLKRPRPHFRLSWLMSVLAVLTFPLCWYAALKNAAVLNPASIVVLTTVPILCLFVSQVPLFLKRWIWMAELYEELAAYYERDEPERQAADLSTD